MKVRGYRVELGEVESALAELIPACGRPPSPSLAVRRRDRGWSPLSSRNRDDEPLSTEGLRHYLKDRLPDYMVPAGFVTSAGPSRTAGGKVDRRALRRRLRERPASTGPASPRAPLWRSSWRACGARC